MLSGVSKCIVNSFSTSFQLLNVLHIVLNNDNVPYCTALAQMVACLPLVQQVQGSIPGGVVNFNLKIFNLGARRGGDVHFLITRLYITVLD